MVVVRELSFGPSLEELIRLGPHPEGVVVAVLDQLLDGLAVLHKGGRAHLRLTPEVVRFDLLSGMFKVADLEEAELLPEPRAGRIPAFLEPDVRVGLGGPRSDVFSVGRIGSALLGAGAFGSLASLLVRCQATSSSSGPEGRPADAGAALAELRALGISVAEAATLPLGKFVRAHVGALRELRRWRAQPLPPSNEVATGTYREVLSSALAARLWGRVGFGAVVALGLTLHLIGTPARGGELAVRFAGDACSEDVHATVVQSADAAPKQSVIVTPDSAQRGGHRHRRVRVGCPLDRGGVVGRRPRTARPESRGRRAGGRAGHHRQARRARARRSGRRARTRQPPRERRRRGGDLPQGVEGGTLGATRTVRSHPGGDDGPHLSPSARGGRGQGREGPEPARRVAGWDRARTGRSASRAATAEARRGDLQRGAGRRGGASAGAAARSGDRPETGRRPAHGHPDPRRFAASAAARRGRRPG